MELAGNYDYSARGGFGYCGMLLSKLSKYCKQQNNLFTCVASIQEILAIIPVYGLHTVQTRKSLWTDLARLDFSI